MFFLDRIRVPVKEKMDILYKANSNFNFDKLRLMCPKCNKETIHYALDENIVERIKELAEDDDRSFSQYINMVLKEHLNTIEKSDK